MTDSRTAQNLARALAAVAVLAAVAAGAVLLFAPVATVGDPSDIEAQLGSPTKQIALLDTSETTAQIDNASEGLLSPNPVNLLEELPDPSDAVPVQLRIDALGVDAHVDPYGIDANGQMDVPTNVSDVGWYRYGPIPGEPGSAVLAAHVDLAGQGPGVFFDLRTLEPGDRIMITFSNGSEQWFATTARTVYQKEELPLDTIFSRTGNPVLTLITCGGGFNRAVQRYDSNVVVYAVPIASPARTRSPA